MYRKQSARGHNLAMKGRRVEEREHGGWERFHHFPRIPCSAFIKIEESATCDEARCRLVRMGKFGFGPGVCLARLGLYLWLLCRFCLMHLPYRCTSTFYMVLHEQDSMSRMIPVSTKRPCVCTCPEKARLTRSMWRTRPCSRRQLCWHFHLKVTGQCSTKADAAYIFHLTAVLNRTRNNI